MKIDPDIPVECASCGHKNSRPMSSLRDGGKVACVCGTESTIKAPKLAQTNASMRDLERALNKLGRRR